MTTINGKACVANGTPVDKVFSDGRQVYSRNLLADSGFESGNVPANYTWGVPDTSIRTVKVMPATGTFPTPFGNYMLKIDNYSSDSSTIPDQYVQYQLAEPVVIKAGEAWTYSYYYVSAGAATGQASDYLLFADKSPLFPLSMGHDLRETSGGQTTWHRFVKTWTADRDVTVTALRFGFIRKSTNGTGWVCIDNIKLEQYPTATPWTPAPEDVM